MINWVSNRRTVALTLGMAGSCLVLNGCAKNYGGGGGGGATVSLAPSSLTFSTQAVGTTSAAKSVTLTNSGTAILYITSITITGANASDFAETNTCGGSVNASGNCTISVTFTPSASGALVAAVTITDGATGSPQTISLTGTGAAATPVATVTPSSLTFGNQTMGSTSAPQTVTLLNAGTASLSINSVTLSDTSNFAIQSSTTCTAGTSVDIGASCTVSVVFKPQMAQAFNATLSIADNASGSPQTVSLSGTGVVATTVANVSPTSLAFGNVTVNTTSAPQTVTISNGGTTTFSLTAITPSPAPPFAVSNVSPALPASLAAGQSLSFQATFAPTTATASSGTVSITYSDAGLNGNSSDNSVSLSGTGVAAGSGTACGAGGTLTITTTNLPDATSASNYIAFLQASGGSGTCTWSLASGSTLPSGMVFDKSGVIFGTTPTVSSTTGNITSNFTVQVTDGTTTATAALSFTTKSSTGANCNSVYVDVGESGPSDTLTPTPLTIGNILNGNHLVPLDDLGTKTYQPPGSTTAEEGGLYPNGTNTRPTSYDTTGVNLAKSIGPLDSNGNSCTGTAPSCSLVLITIGMSNAKIESTQFLTDLTGDKSLNPNLVLVNGAHDGSDANHVANLSDPYWTTDIPTALSNAGVSANQVVAAWVKEGLAGQQGGGSNFPGDANTLASKLETIAQNLKTKFPDIKLAYLSSRIYAGYATSNLNPEPVAYESGFAVKFAVASSIPVSDGGTGTLTAAPWIAWGPYLWANGMLPRSDGTVWTCQDLSGDGTHPNIKTGGEKVARKLINFFKTDSTTKPWFCASGACP